MRSHAHAFCLLPLAQPKELWYDQDHAMAALTWMDKRRGTEDARQFMALRADFTSDKPSWVIQNACDRFERMVQGIDFVRRSVTS